MNNSMPNPWIITICLGIVWSGRKNFWNKETQNFWNKRSEQLKKNNWIQNKEIHKEYKTISFGTSIYITPGFTFHIIDDLITNFHLPESSLLVLVNSILPEWKIMELYKYAIKKLYRFYSFGDGMYIRSKQEKSKWVFLHPKRIYIIRLTIL